MLRAFGVLELKTQTYFSEKRKDMKGRRDPMTHIPASVQYLREEERLQA
jgi:hypothetical protein